jgi:hypothetical protein
MRTIGYRIYLVVLSLLFVSHQEARALDCGPPDRKQQIETASDVFVGRILRRYQRYFLVEVVSTLKGAAKGKVKVQISVWGVQTSGVLGKNVLFAVSKTSDPKIFQLEDCDSLFNP